MKRQRPTLEECRWILAANEAEESKKKEPMLFPSYCCDRYIGMNSIHSKTMRAVLVAAAKKRLKNA